MVVLDFYGLAGRHLVMDAVISTVYRNTILSTSLIPGNVAKLAEDKNFKADDVSSQRVSCKHGAWRSCSRYRVLPFAMEDGGSLGAHAHALLKTPAEHAAVSAGRYSSPDSLI